MTMKICLMINASDQWRESSQYAHALAQSIYSNGHQINTVFFYGQAVKVIQSPKHLKQWQQLQRSTHSTLQLCSTLIEKHQLDSLANTTEGFEVVSLGSLVQAMEAADKTVELN